MNEPSYRESAPLNSHKQNAVVFTPGSFWTLGTAAAAATAASSDVNLSAMKSRLPVYAGSCTVEEEERVGVGRTRKGEGRSQTVPPRDHFGKRFLQTGIMASANDSRWMQEK